MITKEFRADQIEILADGTAQIRFRKLIVEDGETILDQWHRMAVPPGVDIAAQVKAVHKHMASPDMGAYPPMSDDDTGWVQALCDAAHTPEVVDAFTKNMVSPGDKPKKAKSPTGIMERKTVIDQVVYRHDGEVRVQASSVLEDNGVVLVKSALPMVVVDAAEPMDAQLAEAGLPAISDPKTLERAQAVTDVAAEQATERLAKAEQARDTANAESVKG